MMRDHRSLGGSRVRVRHVLRAAALLTFASACKGTDTGVDWQFERMLVQPRYEAYRGSRFFADGRAMQPPPRGTVPRGASADPIVVTGRTAAGYAGVVPIALTRALLERGRRNFDITCATCHGVLGDGESPVARRMQLRPPPSLQSDSIRAYSPGLLFRIVREGYGLMPSYASMLSIEDSWATVAYLRALQLSQGARLEALPPALRREAIEKANRGARETGAPR
jgi:mono/diheme cytochrome c family protein